MRRTFYALAVLVTGAFALAMSAPAHAASTGPLTSLAGITKAAPVVEKARWRRRHWRHRPYWRHRHWRRRHYYRYPYWRHHRRCYWRHGRRICRRWW